jgi:hypothetical protein
LSFIRAYPLGFLTEGVAVRESSGQHRYHVHSCVGARVGGRDETFVVDLPVALGLQSPFLVSPDGTRLLHLWPFLFARVAEQTGHHTLAVFERLLDDSRFLTGVRAAAIDHRAGWDVRLHDRAVADAGWLRERLEQSPFVAELPAGIRLAEGLMPSRGDELIERMLGPNLVRAVVGRGGFGTVYAAEGPQGRRLAIKVLMLRERSEAYLRFRREFATLQQAGEHPGIIRCFDLDSTVIEGREYPWYSMEFAAGGDLAGRLQESNQEHPPWDEPEARREIVHTFRDLAGAVAHLHSLDILHRDLKPGNVLIMEDGTLKLSDFGLVKDVGPEASGGQSSLGAVLGTWRYMAPEQQSAGPVSPATDVYALGVILAEMATGERPEPDAQVGRGTTLHRSAFVRKLPAPLREFLGRCTDVSPANRPTDARTALAEFDKTIAAMR